MTNFEAGQPWRLRLLCRVPLSTSRLEIGDDHVDEAGKARGRALVRVVGAKRVKSNPGP